MASDHRASDHRASEIKAANIRASEIKAANINAAQQPPTRPRQLQRRQPPDRPDRWWKTAGKQWWDQARDRLERRWVSPSYGGGLMIFLAVFFFGAATNAMVGWLYVISGTIAALLLVAAVLARRSLRGLEVRRLPLAPTEAGEGIALELELHNHGRSPQVLLTVVDEWPLGLATESRESQTKSQTKSQARSLHRPPQSHRPSLAPKIAPNIAQVERVEAGQRLRLRLEVATARRGIYRWERLALRSAAPLGLFWAQRPLVAPAKGVVYPQVLPLTRCPLLDTLGDRGSPRLLQDDRQSKAASEGLTRSLRPYRWGDSLRLVHWRTSARRGSLQLRELETGTHGPDLILALDLAAPWHPDDFEQAAIAVASIYRYAGRLSLDPWLWTATTGTVRGRQVVLEALAGAQPGSGAASEPPPGRPLLWLSANPASLAGLVSGSRWLLWLPEGQTWQVAGPTSQSWGKVIGGDRPLIAQLQEL